MSKLSFYKKIITVDYHFDSKIKNFAFLLLKIIFRIVDKFYFDNSFIRASGLAFNSLLALVPLSAVLFAFGGLSSVSSSIQDFFVEVLLPSSLNQIVDALNMFTENSTKLGTLGIVLFLFTVLMLMNNIENNLNSVWQCQRKRTFLQQFTIYTTLLVFVSLLIGGNFSISGKILSIIPDYAKTLNEPVFLRIGYRLSSIIFITLTLMLLIIMVPSVKVAILSAFTGALTGAVLWELAKWGFKTWANYSVRNSIIYGSLFLVPLLLIWLYVAWLIIMISMETAFIHNHRKEPYFRYNEIVPLADSFTILTELYLKIAFIYFQAEIKATLSYLAEEIGLTEREISFFTDRLIYENLILKSDDGFFIPSSPPESVKLSILYSTISGVTKRKDTKIDKIYSESTIKLFYSGADKELKNLTVSDLIKQNENT